MEASDKKIIGDYLGFLKNLNWRKGREYTQKVIHIICLMIEYKLGMWEGHQIPAIPLSMTAEQMVTFCFSISDHVDRDDEDNLDYTYTVAEDMATLVHAMCDPHAINKAMELKIAG